MKLLSKIILVLVSAIFLNTTAVPAEIEEEIAAPVMRVVKSQLKQVFKSALAVSDATIVPSDENSLTSWALYFLSKDERLGIAISTMRAISGFRGFEQELGRRLQLYLYSATVDELISRMVVGAINAMVGPSVSTLCSKMLITGPSTETLSAILPLGSPREPPSVAVGSGGPLTRNQVSELKDELSLQGKRTAILRSSYETWGLQDWLGYLLYNLIDKVNKALEWVESWIQLTLVDQIIKLENALAREVIALVGGTLVGLVHPAAGVTTTSLIRRQRVIGLPAVILARQSQAMKCLLIRFIANRLPLFSISAADIVKYHTEVMSIRIETIKVKGAEEEVVVVNFENVSPIFGSALSHSSANTTTAKKVLTTETAARQPSSTSYSAYLLGAASVVVRGAVGTFGAAARGAGAVFYVASIWGKGS